MIDMSPRLVHELTGKNSPGEPYTAGSYGHRDKVILGII